MVDITVHGAGIFGLSVAWACVMRGACVQIIDPNGPGAGASGGLVGAMAPHVPENWNVKKAFQLDSLLMAETWWTDVCTIGGVDAGYGRLGRIQPLANQTAVDLARARAIGAQDLWRGAARWWVTDAPSAFAPQSPTGLWVQDDLTARLHPKRAVDALVAGLAARGVAIAQQAKPRGKQIWATGWQGLKTMSQDQPRSVGTGIKGQAISLHYDAGHVPQVFADGLHIVPQADGTCAIGSTSERDFDHADETDAQCEVLRARAETILPQLKGCPEAGRWAGVRPRARSRAPMLGPWPGRPDHFVANGGFKIGFGMAPKVAECMADLVLEGRNTIPDAFRVEASQ